MEREREREREIQRERERERGRLERTRLAVFVLFSRNRDRLLSARSFFADNLRLRQCLFLATNTEGVAPPTSTCVVTYCKFANMVASSW